MKCPRCGGTLPPKSQSCPACGQPLELSSGIRPLTVILIVLFAANIIAACIVLPGLLGSSQKPAPAAQITETQTHPAASSQAIQTVTVTVTTTVTAVMPAVAEPETEPPVSETEKQDSNPAVSAKTLDAIYLPEGISFGMRVSDLLAAMRTLRPVNKDAIVTSDSGNLPCYNYYFDTVALYDELVPARMRFFFTDDRLSRFDIEYYVEYESSGELYYVGDASLFADDFEQRTDELTKRFKEFDYIEYPYANSEENYHRYQYSNGEDRMIFVEYLADEDSEGFLRMSLSAV